MTGIEAIKFRPQHEIKSDKTPLAEPMSVKNLAQPQMGQIVELDRYGNPKQRGGYFALTSSIMPRPVTMEQLALINKGMMVRDSDIDLAIDYTRMKRYPLHRIQQSGLYPPEVLEKIKQFVICNAPRMRKVDDLLDAGDKRDTAILVMTGGSLNDTAPMVDALDREKYAVIAMNSAALKVKADYYFAIDRRVKGEWAKKAASDGAKLVALPMVPPDTVTAFEPENRYMFGMAGSHKLNEMVRAHYETDAQGNDLHQGVAEFELGINVGCSALHFAYAMGFKRIIIVGMDVVWDDEKKLHWKRDVNGLTYDAQEDIKSLTVTTVDGQRLTATCRTEYFRAYAMLVGHAYWLGEAGVSVYNCTGAGLVWRYPEAFANWCLRLRKDIHGVERWLPPMPSYTLQEVITSEVING